MAGIDGQPVQYGKTTVSQLSRRCAGVAGIGCGGRTRNQTAASGFGINTVASFAVSQDRQVIADGKIKSTAKTCCGGAIGRRTGFVGADRPGKPHREAIGFGVLPTGIGRADLNVAKHRHRRIQNRRHIGRANGVGFSGAVANTNTAGRALGNGFRAVGTATGFINTGVDRHAADTVNNAVTIHGGAHIRAGLRVGNGRPDRQAAGKVDAL